MDRKMTGLLQWEQSSMSTTPWFSLCKETSKSGAHLQAATTHVEASTGKEGLGSWNNGHKQEE